MTAALPTPHVCIVCIADMGALLLIGTYSSDNGSHDTRTGSLRSELRLTTRRRVVLQPQDVWESTASFAVHLEGLSFGGCHVRPPHRLASGDRYLVHFADQTPESSTAEVRRVRRRGGRYVAGLKFGNSSERLALP